jgi:dipeptidyl aminopeptidase/acylaminoacyl peptidase
MSDSLERREPGPALLAGTHIGVYQVVARIGAGGMGEVYRAHDSKLGRDVAIKALPHSFTNDLERVARFRREAQVLASLNHPCIAQIYGLEEANGTQFLVLELVDGESLDKRIARGAIPVDEALGIAQQIAEALESAHEKGIIHRDLKPANIALTKNGQVKVLDFGLAKAIENPGDSVGAMNSPTITSPARMTNIGVILGTAAYMSPEQARGRAVDKRTDIWAFGCVVYEMLTGRRAFDADDTSAALAYVIAREPDWDILPSELPSPIRNLLRRCLQKDPKHRIQAIGDARLELEDAQAGVERGVGPAHVGATAKRRMWYVGWVAGLVAVIAGVAIWVSSSLMFHDAALPVRRLAITFPPGQEFMGGGLSVVANGQALVYIGPNRQLIYRPLNKLSGTPVENVQADGMAGGVSPSGEWVAFMGSEPSGYVLKKVRMNGGPVTVIGPVHYSCGFTWISDETILGAEEEFGLISIPVNGGTERVIAKTDSARGETGFCFAQPLKDGRHVIVWKTGVQRLAIVDVVTGQVSDLAGPATNPVGIAGGFLAFGRPDEKLVAVPFDLARTRSIESVITVDDQPRTSNGGVSATMSASGDLFYVKATNRTRIAVVDGHGQVMSRTQEDGDFFMPRVSHDGRRLVVARRTEGNPFPHWDLWLFDIASGVGQPLTNDGYSSAPEWTSDGRIIYRRTNAQGLVEVWSTDPDRRTPSERLLAPKLGTGFVVSRTVLSPDGRYAIATVVVSEPSLRFNLYVADLHGDQQLKPFEQTASTYGAAFSPDGHWLAYVSRVSGRNEIYVRPFPQEGPRVRITSNGGVEPHWDSDSRGIVYRDSKTSGLARARLETGEGVSVIHNDELFPFSAVTPPIYTGGSEPSYDPFGTNKFVIVERADPIEVIVVQGFVNELKARGPTK